MSRQTQHEESSTMVKAAAPLTGSLQRNAALTVFTIACTFTCQKAENRADGQKAENRAGG